MIMKKIKMIAGIAWAFAGLLIIIILFPGLTGFSKSLGQLSFMKINPNYSGGDIAFSDTVPGYRLDIRKPVFDGLLGDRKKGFVQLDWRGRIPEIISDTIDFNRDGVSDFVIDINTRESKTGFDPLDRRVESVNVSTATSYGWAVRINLIKP
jgi:hypothetical protein